MLPRGASTTQVIRGFNTLANSAGMVESEDQGLGSIVVLVAAVEKHVLSLSDTRLAAGSLPDKVLELADVCGLSKDS